MTVADILSKHGVTLGSTAPGRHYTTCPHCSSTRSSSEHRGARVLGITIDNRGVRWGCNHCGWTGPEKGSGDHSNGKERNNLPAYVYRDADGVPRFRKIRNLPGREQRFWLEQPDGYGGWIKGTKGADTKLLYRADEVKKAIAEGRTIAVAEGEKDVDNLWSVGIAATCNAHGASELGKRPKWIRAHSEQLRGADIVVPNDHDGAGHAHADATCSLSLGIAKRVRRLDLAKHWPEIPKGGDVSDWLAAGHTGKELTALIEAAPDYVPAAPAEGAKEEAPPSGGNGNDDDAELEVLARLALLDYERARKSAAERLGIKRLSLLDVLVKNKRAELGLDGAEAGQGSRIEFPEPEPWPSPVDGAELLDEIAAAVRKHIVLADHCRDACALWVLHTFLIQYFLVSPKLAIRSPTRGCGKSTLLDVLARLVARPMQAASITTAAIFRTVELYRPTLLIDEVDAFLAQDEGLRGVLNASHRADGAVVRTVGDDHAPRSFRVYSAVALAGIGSLAATLMDRSIIIDLQRRLPTEPVEQLRVGRVGHLDDIRRRIARWIADVGDRVGQVVPTMVPGMLNRIADNWFSLLAIADVAGGPWPERARAAASQAIAGIDANEEGRLELLLADVRDIFESRDRISSAELIDRLVEITPRPWSEYGRSGKPITQNKLARLLQPLHIAPSQIRFGLSDSRKGYRRTDFEEAWGRFLSPTGGFKPKHRNKCDEMGTSELFQTETANPDVSVSKCEKPNNDGLCFGVSVAKGGNGQDVSSPSSDEPGLSRRRIRELAGWYVEQAAAQREGTGDVDSTALDSGLRQVLAEQVLPEFVEAEFARVLAEVFRV